MQMTSISCSASSPTPVQSSTIIDASDDNNFDDSNDAHSDATAGHSDRRQYSTPIQNTLSRLSDASADRQAESVRSFLFAKLVGFSALASSRCSASASTSTSTSKAQTVAVWAVIGSLLVLVAIQAAQVSYTSKMNESTERSQAAETWWRMDFSPAVERVMTKALMLSNLTNFLLTSDSARCKMSSGAVMIGSTCYWYSGNTNWYRHSNPNSSKNQDQMRLIWREARVVCRAHNGYISKVNREHLEELFKLYPNMEKESIWISSRNNFRFIDTSACDRRRYRRDTGSTYDFSDLDKTGLFDFLDQPQRQTQITNCRQVKLLANEQTCTVYSGSSNNAIELDFGVVSCYSRHSFLCAL